MALAEANALLRRPNQSKILDLAGAVSASRKAADVRMERYMHLDELISLADAD